jgi:hypothetical protein
MNKLTFIRFTSALLLMSFLATVAPDRARAQDTQESRLAIACHVIGSWASRAAINRDNDVPISEMLEIILKSSVNRTYSPEMRKFVTAFTAQLDNLVVEVYQSDLTPNNAYLKYREQCQSTGLKTQRAAK